MNYMRVCKRCNQELPDAEFQMRQKRYFRKNCRTCESALRKARGFNPRQQTEERKAWVNSYMRERNRRHRTDPKYRAFIIRRDAVAADQKTGRSNDLTVEFVQSLLDQGCSYCGNKDVFAFSLDRIDNSIGHTKQNVVGACRRCNLVRGDMPHEAWLRLAPAMKSAFDDGLFGDWYPKRRGPKVSLECVTEQAFGADC